MKLSLRTPLAIAALAALFAAAPADAQSRAPKLDRVLQNAHGGERQRVIVRFKPGTASRIEQRIASAGNRIFAKHASIGAMTAELRADQFAAFANDPDVESIGADVDVAPFASMTDTSISSSVLRNTLGESQYAKGAGVGVAIIDSGIAPLPAFYGRITAFYDVTSGVPVPTMPFDDYGHGTHVAGLIGADDSNYMGVAPGVTFVGLKVLNKVGKGATSDVITAIAFAVANRERFNIRVINLSLGHPILAPAADDPLVQAVESATRAGVIVVVSAGNVGINPDTGLLGYAGVTSPGNSPSAITVGAVDTHNTVTHGDDDVPAYSSRGPTWYDGLVKPDVVAPGHAMNSVIDVNSYLFKQYPNLDVKVNSRWYLRLSGTSMATAVTTGVVAAMLESRAWATSSYGVNPGPLTANGAKAMLQYTALPIVRADGTSPDPLTEGTGELNAEGAVRLAWLSVAMWANPASMAPYPQYFVPASVVGDATLPWARQLIWGQNVVTGAGLTAASTAWATNILWGENITWGENILWGENIVWGENIIWGESIVDANSKVLGLSDLGR